MSFIFRSKNSSAVRFSPRLEILEDRRLLTFFAVLQAPQVDASEMASANVSYPQDPGPVVPVSLACDANPAGMGRHNGYFSVVGDKSRGIIITSLPESGQQLGDPIQVSFQFSYTALLENFYDYPPIEDSAISYSASVRGGDTDQDLYKGEISTTFTPGDKISDSGKVSIAMTIGDQILISIFALGEAHAAEPHYRDRVAFFADFSIQDESAGPSTSHHSPVELALTGLASISPKATSGPAVSMLDQSLQQEFLPQENRQITVPTPSSIYLLDLDWMGFAKPSSTDRL